MGLLFPLFMVICLFFLISKSNLVHPHSYPLTQNLCHDDEKSALLQFKKSFIISSTASLYDPWSYPKVASWKLERNRSDCCSWDGVECDERTGHIIGLDLSGSCLYGTINSSSSLFHLVHLQKLNLAYNDFNYSQIPSQVRDLSRLRELNLSSSSFCGQIPLEISQLSHLSSLDLSHNSDFSHSRFLELKLEILNLKGLVANLTHLEKLDLSEVSINSMMPDILTNLSFLTFLSLRQCGLLGEFPIGIFKLPNLRILDIAFNDLLNGYLPSFTWSTPLERLFLFSTSFSGKLPTSMGNLHSLTEFQMWDCNFTGSIPSSLGNLTKLTYLDISNNAFVGNIPFSLGNLVQLSYLDISTNQLTGSIPFSLINLPQLSILHLYNNLLSGEVHVGLMNESGLTVLELSNNRLTDLVTFGPMNFTQLSILDLSTNELHGQISTFVFKIKSLEFLDLSENHLNGIVEFDELVKLESLRSLHLSGNELSLLIKEPTSNVTLQEFQDLGLSSCNLSKFPSFLRNQDKLEYLNLSNNNIHGQVPKWIWNISTISLQVLDLSHNFLTNFGQNPIFLPWVSLQIFYLNSNLVQGSLPTPPISILHFFVSNNFLTGKIPQTFCNLSSLEALDLAYNNLSGPLPPCLGNSSASLAILDLRMNKFQKSIPEMWTRGSKLRMIIFSQNNFQGPLPRSLANCTMLKVLDLSNNQFLDSFPFWLGHLPNLEVLTLRSNNFYGLVGTPKAYFKFPNLRIIDISHNDFTGKLPSILFENWKARKIKDMDTLTYIHEDPGFTVYRGSKFPVGPQTYTFSMTLTTKGTNVLYEKVQEVLFAIDLSSNRFVGEIPKSIGNLREFNLLNLSHNALTGHIPLSMVNLSKLEALDLSQNQLVGEIPQQFTQLTFLEIFNVSHNNLWGPIPQGNQFNTFENNSFEGNLGLCGTPLTKKCVSYVELNTPSPISKEVQDFGSLFEFGWKPVAIGYGFGLIFGVIIGHILFVRKQDWLMKMFKIRQLGAKGHRY